MGHTVVINVDCTLVQVITVLIALLMTNSSRKAGQPRLMIYRYDFIHGKYVSNSLALFFCSSISLYFVLHTVFCPLRTAILVLQSFRITPIRISVKLKVEYYRVPRGSRRYMFRFTSVFFGSATGVSPEPYIHYTPLILKSNT